MFSKTSRTSKQYCGDEQNDSRKDSQSFKMKVRITGKIPDDGNAKDIEKVLPIRYISTYWRSIEMPLINCEINLILPGP